MGQRREVLPLRSGKGKRETKQIHDWVSSICYNLASADLRASYPPTRRKHGMIRVWEEDIQCDTRGRGLCAGKEGKKNTLSGST